MANRSTRPIPIPMMTRTPVIEEDDAWVKAFRRQIQTKAAQRQREVRQQAEAEFRTAITRSSDPEGVRREYKIAMGKLEKLFRDEEEDLIQREKEMRCWSCEGGLTVNAEMVREQEMIMQALVLSRNDVGGGNNHRSMNTPSADRGSNRTGTQHNPTSRWIPPGTAEKYDPHRGRQMSVVADHHSHTTEASRGQRVSNSSATTYSQSSTLNSRAMAPSTPKPIPLQDRLPINDEPRSMPVNSQSESVKRQEEKARVQEELHRKYEELMARKQELMAKEQEDIWQKLKEQQAKHAGSTSEYRISESQAWGNYEDGWSSLKDRQTLHFKTISWPTLVYPTSLEDISISTIGPFLLSPHHSRGKSNMDRIKEQQSRWNGFLLGEQWMPKVADGEKDIVYAGVERVAFGLLGLKVNETRKIAAEKEEEIDRMFEVERLDVDNRPQTAKQEESRAEERSEGILAEEMAELRHLEQLRQRDEQERIQREEVRQSEGQRSTEETPRKQEKTKQQTEFLKIDEEQTLGQRDADSTTEWQKWWQRANASDILSTLDNCIEFDVEGKLECLKMASSAKIYQNLVGFVYAQTKLSHAKPALLDSLRSELSKWGSWDDQEWLLKHDIIRSSLWNMHQEAVSKPISGGDGLRNILNCDLEVISSKLEKILFFLAASSANPVSAMDLLQTLLDRSDLSRGYRSRLARTLAKLAGSAGCYPDSVILRDIRVSGKHPAAGGGFADVWKGRFGERGVALKAFRIFGGEPQQRAFNKLSREAVIWRQLKHPNILPFYGVFRGDEDFDRLCLVSPWMDAGNIMQYIVRVIDCNRISLLADVASGLEYLHSFEPTIVHGDLKGANIFISSFNIACLGDFDLARFRDSEESTRSATTGNSVAGTLRWQAPELFSPSEGESSRVSQETDVYSFGCVCIEVMTGKRPFAEISQDAAFVIAIMNKPKPQRPNEDLLERGLDDSLWETMMQCWDSDPSLRPTALQLVQYFEQRKDPEPRDSRHIQISEFPEAPRTSLGQYGFPDDFVAKVSVA